MIDIRQSQRFKDWFDSLRDRQSQVRVTVRIRRLQQGNPGQHRVLGGGVAEMKIDFGPGYRVYYTQRGSELLLLLVGGDKSTQAQDIATAQRMAQEWKE